MLPLLAAAVVAAHHWELSWFTHFFGLDNLAGPFYGFWSGFGSDLGEVALIGAVLGAYRKHNCHEPGCWRLGKHPLDGTPFVVCAKHHPLVPDKLLPGHMARAHREANPHLYPATVEDVAPEA